MKILVTGGSGFVGGEFIRQTSSRYEITALVRESSNVKDLDQFCKVQSYSSIDDIADIFERGYFSGVLHFASQVSVSHSLADISSLIDSNITFGTYLLEACARFKVSWFINTGTFWQNYNNETYNPVNLYAATKEAFQKIAMYYTQISDLNFVTIKLNDTIGPRDTRKKIFNLWLDSLKNDTSLDMTGGEQLIDISHIDDVVASYTQLISLLESDGNRKFNLNEFVVSNNERVTLHELASIFSEIVGKPLRINWGGRPYRAREVMLPYSLGFPVPGFTQRYTLKESIADIIGKEIK